MLQASVLFLGVELTWLLFAQDPGATVSLAVAAGVVSVIVTMRLPRLGRDTFTRLPRAVVLHASKIGSACAKSLATVRAGLAADVKLNPSIVRIRTRLTDTFGLASLANIIAFATGAIVVAIDEDGLLAHVEHEDESEFENVRLWESDLDGGRNRSEES